MSFQHFTVQTEVVRLIEPITVADIARAGEVLLQHLPNGTNVEVVEHSNHLEIRASKGAQ